MSSTQLNEYLVSAGAYRTRHQLPDRRPAHQLRKRRRWFQRNLIRTQD
jgi:hypothetical protein